MAELNHNSQISPKKENDVDYHYTVTSVTQRNTGKTVPALVLIGDWLRLAGFDPGGNVRVKIANGCLMLISESDDSALVNRLRTRCYELEQRLEKQANRDPGTLIRNTRRKTRATQRVISRSLPGLNRKPTEG